MARLVSLSATVLLLLVILGAWGDSVNAQQTPPTGTAAADEGFSEVVQVSVVNVEVYVTDKDGNPVTGLTKDDFEIYEEGDLQPITNFFAVEKGRPSSAMEGVAPLDEQNRDRPGLERLSLPPEQRLHVIIYVDNFNLRPASRNRTLRRVSAFLRSMVRPGDQVMVVSHDRSLHLRQPFTSDMNLVSTALEELQKLSGIMVDRDAERIRAIREIEDATDQFRAMSEARAYAESVYTEMDFVLRALREQVDLLAGLEGRKAVIYVSDGIPSIAGEDLFLMVDELYPRTRARAEAAVFNIDPEYREMVAAANSAGVTFYALDAGGLAAHSSVSAEFGGTEAGGSMPYVDSIRTANLREPLHQISDDTGGFAIVGTNAVLDNLERLTRDFRNFYSLGFAASHFADGRYYKIDVKVKRPGLEVRHRQGYRDNSPSRRLNDGMLAALYYGAERNPLDVAVAMKDGGTQDGQRMIDVELKVPIEKLTLVARTEHMVGSLQAGVVVLDQKGGVSPVTLQDPVTVAIPTAEVEDALGKHYTYAMTLAFKPGNSRVVLALRDGFGGRTSFLREVVQVQ
ncbi:MAG: VWA domain-containing protein [Thermoanaerobaculia bacterium]|nr:VWA domain-containing protein [Thermoanaerobaculia bacterium]